MDIWGVYPFLGGLLSYPNTQWSLLAFKTKIVTPKIILFQKPRHDLLRLMPAPCWVWFCWRLRGSSSFPHSQSACFYKGSFVCWGFLSKTAIFTLLYKTTWGNFFVIWNYINKQNNAMGNMFIFYIQSLIYILASSQSIYISLSIYMHSDIFYKNGERGVEKATGW